MPQKRDYYEVLGLSRSATQDDVKQAFRKIAKEVHPDRNPGDAAAEDRFKEIQEAFSILHDPEKRRRYDRMGHAAFGGGDAGAERVDFRAATEILEGLFGEVFGRGRRARQGDDIEVDLSVRFEEAALGAEKTLTIERLAPCETCKATGAAPGSKIDRCPACNGLGEVKFQRGFFSASRPCSTCGGSGKRIEVPCPTCKGRMVAPIKEELLVKVPPGVEDGAIRSVRGAGARPAPVGGQTPAPGDLHVRIRIEPHPLFSRAGADVLVTIPIGFPAAVLGTQIDVPTLEGKVKMKIPPGTQSGKQFRLRGKGIEVFGGAGKGDQLVTVVVEVPEQITKKQRQLIEELARELGEDVQPLQKSFFDKLRDLFE